jgi:hypothetical protein
MDEIGINQGTSGNVSARVPGGFLVTPSGLPYDQMRSDDSFLWRFLFGFFCVGKHVPPAKTKQIYKNIQKPPDAHFCEALRRPLSFLAALLAIIWLDWCL